MRIADGGSNVVRSQRIHALPRFIHRVKNLLVIENTRRRLTLLLEPEEGARIKCFNALVIDVVRPWQKVEAGQTSRSTLQLRLLLPASNHF
jgi:hypothetical protein